MRYYEDILNALGMTCAQVLLTLDNLADRSQYINARNTFTELLAYGTIPVVNENDTVAVQELRFGDNDTLSAQVATLVEADYLFLMTDVDALYTANPKLDSTATPIHEVEDISSLTADTSTTGTQWGTGGMVTKLTAARIATAAGCCLVICTSARPEGILEILNGARRGTKFYPLARSLKGRKRWLLTVPVRGSLWLDDGATHAVKDKHNSLFPVGVIKVVGQFEAQDAVSLCDASGHEFARGLINFPSKEVLLMQGKKTEHLKESKVLEYVTNWELIHRGNLALLLQGEDEEWPKKGMREKLAQRLAANSSISGVEDVGSVVCLSSTGTTSSISALAPVKSAPAAGTTAPVTTAGQQQTEQQQKQQQLVQQLQQQQQLQ
eukprot:GHRR01012282.1.p1 GENE.GHRR01012282.1~~GHRR01012282.1.p1  ORF type:complete len:380 (+),score=137.77 GHRR01012282.1:639-1778(+)